MRKQLRDFYQRRASNLQHKKYKLLARWAHYIQRSDSIENVGLKLDESQAYNIASERYERLNQDDNYEEFDKLNKPHPTTKQGRHQGKPRYIENENKEANSLIREDDIEVYL